MSAASTLTSVPARAASCNTSAWRVAVSASLNLPCCASDAASPSLFSSNTGNECMRTRCMYEYSVYETLCELMLPFAGVLIENKRACMLVLSEE
jgi:hypothetical protein